MISSQSNAAGASQYLINATWNGFVAAILDIAIAAYNRMIPRVRVIGYNWPEKTFTNNLYTHFDEIRRERELPWNVSIENPVLNPGLLDGSINPDEAKEIDICVRMTFSDPKIYFAFECKLVSDQYRTRKRNLIKAYVDEGMKRFIIEETYSQEISDAAMIGYILAGTPSRVAKQVNKYLKQSAITGPLHRSRIMDTNNGSAIYKSEHVRYKSQQRLYLYHLLLDFGFDRTDS